MYIHGRITRQLLTTSKRANLKGSLLPSVDSNKRRKPLPSQLSPLSSTTRNPAIFINRRRAHPFAMHRLSRQIRPGRALLRQIARRSYASSTSPYAATVDNLRINSNTKVIFQGFTGKQGTYVTDGPIH